MKISLIKLYGNIASPMGNISKFAGNQSLGLAKVYGFELMLDLKNCNTSLFNRNSLDNYFDELCNLISMEKAEVHFWDDVGVPLSEQQTDPHTKGTSAVCFILTSSIVIHTLDILKTVYVNIFSCKTFDPNVTTKFTKNWFQGEILNSTFFERYYPGE